MKSKLFSIFHNSRIPLKIFVLTLALCLFSGVLWGQHHHEESSATQEAEAENPASEFLMSQGAGTAVNPSSGMMHSSAKKAGGWNLMTHGYAFLNYIEGSGPRGDQELFSTNHLMFIGERQLNSKSTFVVRSMMSLEPLTIEDGFYPF